MNQATAKVIESIADELIVLAHLIMEDDTISINKKINKNTLRDSQLNKNIAQAVAYSDDIVIQALFNNYITFIEWDRPPNYGKQPPLDSLRDWALSKGIPTDNNTLFAIAKAIQRDGHEGRPILAVLAKEITESFDKGYYDRLFTAITDEINKYFN